MIFGDGVFMAFICFDTEEYARVVNEIHRGVADIHRNLKSHKISVLGPSYRLPQIHI